MSGSKHFEEDNNFEGKRKKPKRNSCPIRDRCSRDGKEDPYRNENLSELSDFHSSSTGRSSISNESIFGNPNKSSSPFPNQDESLITIRDGSHSPRPSSIQPPQNNSFNDFSRQPLENSMPIFVDEMPLDSLQTTSDDVNKNYVTCQESKSLQVDPALTEFAILDELVLDQEEGEMIESHSEEFTDSKLHEELSTGDINKTLDEGVPGNLKSSSNKECPVEYRQIVVVDKIGHNRDLLPENWIQLIHICGMPVYLNKKSRVCTMARPYYLGPGCSRSHNIPLSAIPCLHYKQATEREKNNKKEREKKKYEQPQSEFEQISAEVETFEELEANKSLEPSELHDYCKKAFKFKTVNVSPLIPWSVKRKLMKKIKNTKEKLRPNSPKGTQVLKFPIKSPDATVCETTGEWVFGPNGKNHLIQLHEYVCKALRKSYNYEFQEVENPATPYLATVLIEDIKYGFGKGASKREAKNKAAKAALEVLLSGTKNKIDADGQFGMKSASTKENNDNEVTFFDQMKVEDPRVTEFCAQSGEPPPYDILLTCLGRKEGNSDQIVIAYEMNPEAHQANKCTLTVIKYKATVPCQNMLEGKQRAAQAILKEIHPNVTYWDSLLQMYGNRSIKKLKEEEKALKKVIQLGKDTQKEIIKLGNNAPLNLPNFALLNKLKTKLLKLKAK